MEQGVGRVVPVNKKTLYWYSNINIPMGRPTILFAVWASDYAYSGQLYQLDYNNEIAVIAYTSQTFKGTERKLLHNRRKRTPCNSAVPEEIQNIHLGPATHHHNR